MANSKFDFDFIIIGSGFGGSVSALRLAEKSYRVCVLERGKRYRAQDFPKTNKNLRKYLWMPKLKFFGIQNLSIFKDIFVLSGCGVGGGSLVYASTLLVPPDPFFQAPQWAHLADWKKELTPHYETAKKMLGVAPNPLITEVDIKLKEVAQEMGCAHTFKPVDVGIYFGRKGDEGKLVPDPYFGGKGPERAGCIFCGGCMVGCQHGAKNTLDKNYLYFAEKLGVVIEPESEVYDIRPIHSRYGKDGYEVFVKKSTAWFFKKRKVITARSVVLSAGVLGTVNLLLRCKYITQSLSELSSCLGKNVRTNSEALLGVTTRDKNKDFSQGIAITSGFYPEPHTHVEPVRYPKGSSFMKVIAAPMANEGGRFLRPLKMICAALLHPLDTLRLFFNFHWAENTIILLVMQTLENKISFKLGRNIFTLFLKRMTTEAHPSHKVPVFIPIANTIARVLAKKINGIPQSAVNEVLLQIPTTAHVLGGCCMGSTSQEGVQEGVIDTQHRVFGYENMYVCDGSAVSANLGVNPSLTITAMTERCMSFIPESSSSK